MANKGGIPGWDDREWAVLMINGGVQPSLLEKGYEWNAIVLVYIAEESIYLTEPTGFEWVIFSSGPQTSNIEVHHPKLIIAWFQPGPSIIPT